MKKKKVLTAATKSFIILSALSTLYVSMLAFVNPQSVMNLVSVTLTNTDACSSIRGVYGGVGTTICISLIYLLYKSPRTATAFLSLFWGLYALSRVITIFTEGKLGAFGTQWLCIESIFFLLSLTLFIAQSVTSSRTSQTHPIMTGIPV